MGTSGERNWVRLAGVAVLMTFAMLMASAVVGMTLYWDLADEQGRASIAVLALLVVVLVSIAGVPALVVGRVAGLHGRWLAVVVLSSLLVGAALGALVLLAGGPSNPLPALPATVAGLLCGALLGIAVADHVGGSSTDAEPATTDPHRPGPRRSIEHRVIAGVCGGLASAWGMQPAHVRIMAVAATVLLWVAGGILGGVPGFLYLLAWLTWPTESAISPTLLGPRP